MALPLRISERIAAKLKEKHKVSIREVEQCFENREGPLLEDDRSEHKTEPPTQWFVASTNQGRLLKVIFVRDDGEVYVKSAYDANATWQWKYQNDGQGKS